MLYSVLINGLRGWGSGGRRRYVAHFFADDIAMIAASAEETREMLGVLEEYCYKWRFEVNTKKSQVMVCGCEEEELAQERFVFGGKELSKVEEYKYLGVIVTADGKWKHNIARLLSKGRQNLGRLKGFLLRQEQVSVAAKWEVWKALVASGLRYGAEVWWLDKLEERKFERLQLESIKCMLGVSKCTTSSFVRGEVGA